MPPAVLIAGSILWIIGAGLEILQNGFTPLNTAIVALAFAAISAGIWCLQPLARDTRTGMAGIVLTSLGMAVFVTSVIQANITGARNDAEIANTPTYTVAAAMAALGVSLLSYWLIANSGLARSAGLVLVIATAITLCMAFIPGAITLQPFVNIVLAAALGWIGFQIMLKKRR